METIVLCVPGKTFSINFMRSWTDTILECRKQDIPLIISWATGANVYQVRNNCYQNVSKMKYDYLMWIDSDQVWRVKDFFTLLDTMRKNPAIKMLTGVCPMVVEGKADLTTVCSLTTDKDGIITNRLLSKDEVISLPALSKIDASGLFFCMMRYGVMEKLEYPWFRPVIVTDKRTGKDIHFFSEDISLFINLKKLGIDLICNTKLHIGHEKDKIYYIK